jgi:DNA-binding beta-propeller fold protein YncE
MAQVSGGLILPDLEYLDNFSDRSAILQKHRRGEVKTASRKCSSLWVILIACSIPLTFLPNTVSSEEIYRFDRMWPTLRQPWYFGSGGSVAVEKSGKVYLADSQYHRILVFNLLGQFITKWGSHGSGNGQFAWPKGIAIDNSSGRVYVADRGNHRVQVFDASGQYITQWGGYGAGSGQFDWSLLDEHIGIALDDTSGNVYVVDHGNNRVQVFDASGHYLKGWGTFGTGNGEFDSPIGIAVDSARGHVYVTDKGNHRIQVFDPGGAYVRQWGSYGAGDNQFKWISGIAVNNSTGTIYVAES